METVGYDLVSSLLRALPIDAASAFGGAALKRLGSITGRQKQLRAVGVR